MDFVIYTTPSCGYCHKAKKLITDCGHNYVEKVIGIDLTKEEFFAKMGPQIRSVPQVFLREDRIGGYDKLQEYFEETTNNFGKQGF